MAGNVTREDYNWARGAGVAGEFQSFCLAVIEDATVSEVVSLLPVTETVGVLNFRDELRFQSYDDWDPNRLMVGLLQVDTWTIMYEVNGYAGEGASIMLPISEGRRVFTHYYSDGTGSSSFTLFEYGKFAANCRVKVGIEDLQAATPEQSAELTALMREVGFESPETAPPPDGETNRNQAATFALMERLTGFRLEPQTIVDGSFTVVRVRAS